MAGVSEAAWRGEGPGGVFRPLFGFDERDFAAHLRRLSPEDRRSRFQHDVSDAQLDRHARAALRGRGRVIGWFDEGVLRGAAEVLLSPEGETAEGAFEVEAAFRGRGVGSALVGAALLWARNRGAKRLVVHTTRRNVPMLRAAARYDAAFEFDLSEADGVIATHAPSLRSHVDEALATEAALARWAWDATMRRLREAFVARSDADPAAVATDRPGG